MIEAILRAGRERSVRARHPWVFAGAIARVEGGECVRGEVVDVRDARGHWLARGTWSTASQIRLRLLTWRKDEAVDEAMFRRRLEAAIRLRAELGGLQEDAACRLVYAESDGLPGLIVDRYGPHLVVELLTQGMAERAEWIVRLLAELVGPASISDRSEEAMRRKEDLPVGGGLLWGAEPPPRVLVRTGDGLRTWVDLRAGQKTGAYLDQAVNHLRVAEHARGAEVLDAFCYTGGFAVAAARAGAARVTAVDSSAEALATVPANLEANALAVPLECVQENVFQLLRGYRDAGRTFDLIVLDPPKFAYSLSQVEGALRGYKDVNLGAIRLLRPGGVLATFSCSGAVSAEQFQRAVAFAALDAGRDVQVLHRLGQAPDHPVHLSFPEGEYLKGLLCRVP